MTEIAQIYLGNIYQQSDLAKLVDTQTCWTVSLSQSDRPKGRIHTLTDTGIAIGIIKSRDRLIQSGDVFQTDSQQLILVHLQEQELLVLDFAEVANEINPTKLVSLGHLLGNHHYPIAIKEDCLYVQVVTTPQVINQLLEEIEIPGLQIKYQTIDRADKINFAPHHH